MPALVWALNNVVLADAGIYTVEVSNIAGTTTRVKSWFKFVTFFSVFPGR